MQRLFECGGVVLEYIFDSYFQIIAKADFLERRYLKAPVLRRKLVLTLQMVTQEGLEPPTL